MDSSFPFLQDGLVEVFTSLTGKYGRNNPTSENCHNVGGTSKTNHNVPSEGKPFKRVKTGKGGSWRRGNCDNSDDEEKVIMTTCFRKSDLKMPRYKNMKRLAKRGEKVREEERTRLQRGMRCFLKEYEGRTGG